MASPDLKSKVSNLLTYFQASLYTHLITTAVNRDASYPSLGSLPFSYGSPKADSSSEQFPEQYSMIDSPTKLNASLEARGHVDTRTSRGVEEVKDSASTHELEEMLTGSFWKPLNFSDSEDLWIVKSQQIELGGELSKCKGTKRKLVSPVTDVDVTIEFSDTEDQATAQAKRQESKAFLRSKMTLSPVPRPARYVIEDDPPEFQPVTMEKPSAKTLYAEVIGTTYSLGGDGFALHAGDVVSVLQFLETYGLVECRWEGLQGLFPIQKLKMMTPEVEQPKLPRRILALAQKELLNFISRPEQPAQSEPTKLLTRLKQREKTPT